MFLWPSLLWSMVYAAMGLSSVVYGFCFYGLIFYDLLFILPLFNLLLPVVYAAMAWSSVACCLWFWHGLIFSWLWFWLLWPSLLWPVVYASMAWSFLAYGFCFYGLHNLLSYLPEWPVLRRSVVYAHGHCGPKPYFVLLLENRWTFVTLSIPLWLKGTRPVFCFWVVSLARHWLRRPQSIARRRED